MENELNTYMSNYEDLKLKDIVELGKQLVEQETKKEQ